MLHLSSKMCGPGSGVVEAGNGSGLQAGSPAAEPWAAKFWKLGAWSTTPCLPVNPAMFGPTTSTSFVRAFHRLRPPLVHKVLMRLCSPTNWVLLRTSQAGTDVIFLGIPRGPPRRRHRYPRSFVFNLPITIFKRSKRPRESWQPLAGHDHGRGGPFAQLVCSLFQLACLRSWSPTGIGTPGAPCVRRKSQSLLPRRVRPDPPPSPAGWPSRRILVLDCASVLVFAPWSGRLVHP
ncbi:hypothetical protein B0T14DRAFT_2538 [Immersiella caudata]|uniref:Uncharacterized protein n=1 Tax=Immersiella caudata TaxID=314043 RepID=A0AA40CAQ1_9PEZI|nr:hypothetical protein B0T14DRAFT_2538 [Immersiella caudata]